MAEKQEYFVTGPMYNPAHPGIVLKDAVVDALNLSITQAAKMLDIDRVTLSRVLNGRASISVEMALRLSKALGTTPNLWMGMQQAYDLWQAQNIKKIDLSAVQIFPRNDEENLIGTQNL